MKRRFPVAGWSKLALAALMGAAIVSILPGANGDSKPTESNPIGEKFWPSEFGPDDQRGAANRITPEKVTAAARLITQGRIYQLGRLYEHGMPLPGKRHFSLTIPGL